MVRKKKILAQSSGCRPQPMCSGHAKEARSSAIPMVSCCMESERSRNSPCCCNIRQSCCSYAAVELIQNSMAKNCQKNGHSLAGVELVPRNNKKSILGCILYICFAIPTQPFELACVSERCTVQLGVTLEAGKAYLAEPGLSVLTRSYDGLYSHHGPSSGD